jgi:hypothetical protein
VFISGDFTLYKCMCWHLFNVLILVHGYGQDIYISVCPLVFQLLYIVKFDKETAMSRVKDQ